MFPSNNNSTSPSQPQGPTNAPISMPADQPGNTALIPGGTIPYSGAEGEGAAIERIKAARQPEVSMMISQLGEQSQTIEKLVAVLASRLEGVLHYREDQPERPDGDGGLDKRGYHTNSPTSRQLEDVYNTNADTAQRLHSLIDRLEV